MVLQALQFNLSKETSHTLLVCSLVHFTLEAPVLQGSLYSGCPQRGVGLKLRWNNVSRLHHPIWQMTRLDLSLSGFSVTVNMQHAKKGVAFISFFPRLM